MESIDFDNSELLEFLESKKERLDVYHRHVAVVTCSPNPNQEHKTAPFFLNFLTTPLGDKVVGLSISNPLQRSPVIYKLQELKNHEIYSNTFEQLFKGNTCNVQCGILKLPLKTRFVALAGSSGFLEKEIFSEKVLGHEAFSFAQKVDDNIIERIERYKFGNFGKCITVITDDGIYFFVVDKTVRDEHRALFSEIVSLLRKKHNLDAAKYYPIQERIIGSFVLDFNTIFSEEPFLKVSQLMEEYERIKMFITQYL
ncbi:DUF4895 domain-containing protein [Fervidobacterium thailandense]|uniref:DUF4895 domain-containing protein n=1 Tax=Fervidobacterium thailandense TaxID=1008305 RepID=UPI000AA352BD|nr:DUF4895 domain-containing protein [Fervidobacterium thailandense]